MLQLKNIQKVYKLGNESTLALKGIDLEFRKSEFVSILGPSGCGKTTLLNLIGGLDKYTSGDLLIDNKSTKTFNDLDWDAYRNAEIGFVFQSYNLISHLTVLDNVELALSLSGVNASERTKKAKEALVKVGLEKHIHKKPNQMSGGQMQRVAIARAIVNNPRIILADEPTGALDSNTSIQVMELLKEIAEDRLVIMVTHNPDLANEYSTRIIKMLDGQVIEDSKPIKEIEKDIFNSEDVKLVNKRTKMSFLAALKSSFKNLLTKKGRTIVTAIAGSIGIIGIALVLSVSSGMNGYIENMQRDSLAGFPIIVGDNISLTNESEQTNTNLKEFPEDNIFYPYEATANVKSHKNKITQEYVDYINQMDASLYNSISYSSGISTHVAVKTNNNNYKLASTSFNEMPDSKDFIETQYDILNGTYPTKANELALVVDKNNRINIDLLTNFGFDNNISYTVNDFIGKKFKLVTNDDYYTLKNGLYIANNDYEAMYNSNNSIEIEIVCIMRVKETASTEFLSTGIGYTTSLTNSILTKEANSEIVLAQKASPTVNVLTGNSFTSSLTYENLMQTLGGSNLPVGIQIYPKTFDTKELIKDYLAEYNKNLQEVDKVLYVDLAAELSGLLTVMISSISVILSAFAAISLVVSSIMIGIITYVSVVERTKEIGILRAIGARKKDVSRIFNAEALILGFMSGVLGVIVTYIICIPATLIAANAIDKSFKIILPFQTAIGMIILSMFLTFIAGLMPSKGAAKKDPVVALRTE